MKYSSLITILVLILYVWPSTWAMEQQKKVAFQIPEAWQKITQYSPEQSFGQPWFMTRKGDKGPKVIGIIIDPEGDPEKWLFEEGRAGTLIDAYKALQSFIEKVGPEIIKTTGGSAGPETYELITFTSSDASRLNDLVEKLYTLNKVPIRLVIIAWGNGARLVNHATHKLKKGQIIDTLIYLQSPIYESPKSPEETPINYRRLFNLYTKSYNPAGNWAAMGYSERKYRQQPQLDPSLNNFYLPVKNCALYHSDYSSTLQNLDHKDLFSSSFLLQLPPLISKLDTFALNTDCAALLLDKKRTGDQRVDPKIWVNRFVELHPDNSLWIKYGDGTGQEYRLFSDSLMNTLRDVVSRRFTREVSYSSTTLNSLNLAQNDKLYVDWFRRHEEAYRSPLFNKELAEQASRILKPAAQVPVEEPRSPLNTLKTQSEKELKEFLTYEKSLKEPNNPLTRKFNELVEIAKRTGFIAKDAQIEIPSNSEIMISDGKTTIRFYAGYVHFVSTNFLNSASRNDLRLPDFINRQIRNSPELKDSAQKMVNTYKIHLMPKDWDKTKIFLDQFLKTLVNDQELQKRVGAFKVRLAPTIINNQVLPIIVIYVYTGKDDAQKVLNQVYAILQRCPECKPGLGVTPRYNASVDDLLYVAQGDGEDKKDENAKYYEEGRIYYNKDFTGTRQNYHLLNPKDGKTELK